MVPKVTQQGSPKTLPTHPASTHGCWAYPALGVYILGELQSNIGTDPSPPSQLPSLLSISFPFSIFASNYQ